MCAGNKNDRIDSTIKSLKDCIHVRRWHMGFDEIVVVVVHDLFICIDFQSHMRDELGIRPLRSAYECGKNIYSFPFVVLHSSTNIVENRPDDLLPIARKILFLTTFSKQCTKFHSWTTYSSLAHCDKTDVRFYDFFKKVFTIHK